MKKPEKIRCPLPTEKKVGLPRLLKKREYQNPPKRLSD
jgi:hypothetical protein